MKTFYALALVVFLASCGENNIVTTSQTNPIAQTSVEQTSQDITEALASIPEEVKPEQNGRPLDENGKPERKGGGWKQPIPDSVYKGGEITTEEYDEWKVVELSTTYISPKTEVIMNISYILDENNTFSKIEVTSPNYTHMPKFHNGVQDLIGSTVEDAIKFNVSGSSLSTVAFQKVLKNL